MKFFRLDLLTLLISLFILNSCKNEGAVGLQIDPATALSGSLIDTSTIVINTITDKGFNAENSNPTDSVVTSGLGKTPMGYFIDPAFGPTESNMIVPLDLPGGSAYTLPTGTIIIDSAVLALKYADGFYGDSLASKFKVNVYQLGSRPVASRAYYNTSKWTYDNSTLVGTRTFFARTHKPIKIYDIIAGSPDTLKSVPPQLRIPVSRAFINKILFNASSSQLSSSAVFQNNVKGLYITLDKSGTTGAGGTFMFGLTDSLNVYYHTLSGTTIDTAMVALPISALNSSHAAQITRTPSSAVTTELANTGKSRDVVYLQGLAGLRAKISFPYLRHILDTVGSRIVINKAELVITPVPGSDIPYHALPKLTMYQYDNTHNPIQLQDANAGIGGDPRSGGIAVFGGFYLPALKSYHFIVTGYIQDLMDGKTKDYGTFIAPVDTTNRRTVDIGTTPQTAGRSIIVGTDKNSPYRIKLNIVYTKLK